ncbi:MAG: metallophosphoesterase, partial [Syntrophaceae bacterium]|nr:metallophosphoesterase [Syntrophaceae bacterium]
MKSLKIRIFSFLLILSLISIPANLLAKVYKLTILHTNDHHGHFMKFDPYPEKDVGGLAAQSTLVNIIRAEIEKAGAHLLLLSGGDINTGVPESDLLDAEPDIKLMNIIGYDAMVLGNHEFENPLGVLMKQQKWAEFHFLSANIVKGEIGEPLFRRYILKDFDGLTVAIFGLTTEEVPILTPPEHTKTLKFKGIIDTARALVPELRREADIVIALTHAGLWEDSGQGHKTAGDLKLAQEVSGIDIIIGGHSHTAMKEPRIVKDTIIVQAGAYSEYVGRLDIAFDSDKGDIRDHTFHLIPVNKKKGIQYGGKHYYAYDGTGYMEDQEILSAMKPYLKKINQALSQTVGETVLQLQGGGKENSTT